MSLSNRCVILKLKLTGKREKTRREREKVIWGSVHIRYKT